MGAHGMPLLLRLLREHACECVCARACTHVWTPQRTSQQHASHFPLARSLARSRTAAFRLPLLARAVRQRHPAADDAPGLPAPRSAQARPQDRLLHGVCLVPRCWRLCLRAYACCCTSSLCLLARACLLVLAAVPACLCSLLPQLLCGRCLLCLLLCACCRTYLPCLLACVCC